MALPCRDTCAGNAVMKTYGDKKNLWYRPKCRKGGNLLRLAMDSNSWVAKARPLGSPG